MGNGMGVLLVSSVACFDCCCCLEAGNGVCGKELVMCGVAGARFGPGDAALAPPINLL